MSHFILRYIAVNTEDIKQDPNSRSFCRCLKIHLNCVRDFRSSFSLHHHFEVYFKYNLCISSVCKKTKSQKNKEAEKGKSTKHQMIENVETLKLVEILQSKRKTAEQNLIISTKPLTINTSGNLNPQLFTEVEQIENVKLSETTGFKKNLKDDSAFF